MRAPCLLLIGSCLISLLACGSSSHSTPQNPVFTSTPVTSAAQDISYSYTLAATDPSGGTITFSLPTAPTGASLTGSTINWVPSASESRVSNSFTAQATSSSGGSATQSWAVTPLGIVTVNWVNTDWTPGGAVPNPVDTATPPSALVPQPDGSLSLLTGNLVSPGVYNIVNVPGGNYWLIQGAPGGLPPIGFWTSSSTFDLGRDISGYPVGVLNGSETITFDFNLSGLDPTSTASLVGFLADNPPIPPIYVTGQAGATTLTASASLSSKIDWTTVNTAFLLQYEPESLGPLNNLVAGPELTLSNLALTNGASNAITGTLTQSPQSSIELSIPGSQWAPLFQNIGPAAATAASSWLAVAVEPYVTGVNTYTSLIGPNTSLVQPDINGMPQAFVICPGQPFFLQDYGDPVMVTDQNFGTLQYGDPFPAAWTRSVNFCQSATVPFSVNGQSFPFALNFGESVAPSNSPLAPLAAPVTNPTVNGSSLFTTTSVNNTVETLSWTAPSGTAPYGYTVMVLQVIPQQSGVELLTVGTYGTAQTSMTLPPLTAGNTYIFIIVTDVDGAASMETSPYRSQLPTGFATVMSSQITVNSGASRPQLRGDAKEWERFLHPRGQVYRLGAGGK
jgi:hypothetical protein